MAGTGTWVCTYRAPLPFEDARRHCHMQWGTLPTSLNMLTDHIPSRLAAQGSAPGGFWVGARRADAGSPWLWVGWGTAFFPGYFLGSVTAPVPSEVSGMRGRIGSHPRRDGGVQATSCVASC